MLHLFKKCFWLAFLLLCQQTWAQKSKYWVFFKDKPHATDQRTWVSAECLENRQRVNLPLYQESDVTVYEIYCDSVVSLGAQLVVSSRWLNAISIIADANIINQIASLPFVVQIKPLDKHWHILQTNWVNQITEKEYGTALRQLGVEAFEALGLNGEGITIGVVDAGFYEAHTQSYLKPIFEENRILGVRDYLSPERTEHFSMAETNSDTHGTTVLQMIAGKNENSQKGLAYKAKFYLARTDHGVKEYRGEEDLWIAAIEWLDSLGVRLVNTSLGYALRHDNPEEDYTPTQMDGKTTAITKAAQIASEQKGMLLVVSAGNEGVESKWMVVSAPADAQGVLSVGATEENFSKADYSSVGPPFLPYLKPNVACFSRNGTSFSAPVITGFAACLMQRKPQASAKEIFELIEKSGNLYPYGNNYLGYGVPNCQIALDLLDKKTVKRPILEKRFKGKNFAKIAIKSKGLTYATVFHKINNRIVAEQVKARGFNGKFRVEKPNNTQFSTLMTKEQVIEIEW